MKHAISMSAVVVTMLFGTMPLQSQELSVRKIKDVVIYEDAKFYSAFPSVVKRPDGELLVAFRRAPNRRALGEGWDTHIDPNAQMVLVRSKDGETWTKSPELIYADPLGGSSDVNMVQLRDGTLLCTSYTWTLVQSTAIEKLKQPLCTDITIFPGATALMTGGYLLRSRDGGKSWEGPIFPPT